MKQLPIKRFIPRTIIYVIILVSTFYAVRFILDFFGLFYTGIDNARYLLSAMAQSQAAIIAVVMTVSLVAVQLGASAYSPRIANIFKSNPDLWILLSLYGTSISYDFIVLKILSDKKAIRKRLLEDIRPPVVLRSGPVNSGNEEWWRGEDPFEPAADIIRGAFMKHDYETVRTGLRRMTAKVIAAYEGHLKEIRASKDGSQNKEQSL